MIKKVTLTKVYFFKQELFFKSSLIFSLIDGVPHAQIPLPGELQQVNGTFHPISTPVISGRRAYILTQFIPEGQKVPILKRPY